LYRHSHPLNHAAGIRHRHVLTNTSDHTSQPIQARQPVERWSIQTIQKQTESSGFVQLYMTAGTVACSLRPGEVVVQRSPDPGIAERPVTDMSTTTALRPDSAWDNNDRPLKRGHEEVVTPTTPRPPTSQTFQSLSAEVGTDNVADPLVTTSLPNDKVSLPPSTFAFPAQHDPQRNMLYRGSSQASIQSSMAVDDMDMDGSEDDQDGSDNDTENGEPGRSSKKKKGQRFFCTEFPPCNLSFTRSEHLARHIRFIHTLVVESPCFC
jgi:hypothetical protein